LVKRLATPSVVEGTSVSRDSVLPWHR